MSGLRLMARWYLRYARILMRRAIWRSRKNRSRARLVGQAMCGAIKQAASAKEAASVAQSSTNTGVIHATTVITLTEPTPKLEKRVSLNLPTTIKASCRNGGGVCVIESTDDEDCAVYACAMCDFRFQYRKSVPESHSYYMGDVAGWIRKEVMA